MRLFIAINFNESMKIKLKELIYKLKEYSTSGSFSRIENLHITLAFLGEVDENKVSDIKAIMDKIQGEAFEIELSGIGSFKGREWKEATYWCGIEHNDSLIRIQGKLVKDLKEAGFYIDNKSFKPHITLARRCVVSKDFNKSNLEVKGTHSSMTVNEITLMKSERIGGVLTYSEVYKRIIDR